VGIIARSRSAEGFANNVLLISHLSGDSGFLARYQPAMDGTDADLRAAVPKMSADLDQITDLVRKQVVVALQDVMVAADARRSDLRAALGMFSGACLAILAVLITMSVVIYLQNNAERRRSEVTRIALHNLQVTIESSLDAVFIADRNGRLIGCNAAAERLFALTRQAARGLPFADLIGSPEWAGTEPQELCAGLCAASHHNDAPDARLVLTGHSRDGRSFPVELSISEAQAAGGSRMYIAFVRDISERIEREESLREARNEALKGQEAKSRFLAVMSHEMRTPLNGLIAASELLQTSTTLDQRQAWLSEIVLSCGWAALDQVNNVLELARLNADSPNSYPEAAFDVTELLLDLVRQNQPQANKRDTSLTLETALQGPLVVRGARALFLRVVYNLLGNAIKFTDGGQITLRLSATPVDAPIEGGVSLTVQVEDTGIGIAEDDLLRIFHNFETLDTSYARMREGTGLGLGIAKLSAEAMGGE
ncbi:MAG: PAS domain S-box protein, partial [Rhodobacteraceae bacterium]|nr:PAS domain S-box protein [Paracoccaceae bacterium]